MANKSDKQHEIDISEEYTRSYDIRYIAEIRHIGLGTYRIIKDLDKSILRNKIAAQFVKWDSQWSTIKAREEQATNKEASLNEAEIRTKEAADALDAIENILLHTLPIDDAVDWESLKDFSDFPEENPKGNLAYELEKIKFPSKPTLKDDPIKPIESNYEPKISLIDKIITSRKERKINEANSEYKQALAKWEKDCLENKKLNSNLTSTYEKEVEQVNNKIEEIKRKYDELEAKWKKKKQDFLETHESNNKKIDLLKEAYLKGEPLAVLQNCELVLNNSQYPDSFPRDFDIEYNPQNRTIVLDYTLPSPSHLPTLKEVKYIATKKELKEYYISETQNNKNYDSVIYKIALRTIHELYEADVAEAIDSIIFNGWVNSIDKATGKPVNNCIASLQAEKTSFLEIDLGNVDPKACFKSLKGISSSKLSGITAIQPIAVINKNDKRFVSSYDVADSLNQGDNLAAMDWEDFEHLIREVFEKEFNSNGGEVKVTQASRDGGVDAIAFDPDPIRGGKIVIQAKRYTNTVGVSAVRDLYGTVLNEGATKGILVTTADYGPDAYGFAKDKPITLMNGANLLFLLEKHGHKARINLIEAKKLMQ
ncbi:MAG: restriction endonuclease [Cyclobacteriaceae bacterium]